MVVRDTSSCPRMLMAIEVKFGQRKGWLARNDCNVTSSVALRVTFKETSDGLSNC